MSDPSSRKPLVFMMYTHGRPFFHKLPHCLTKGASPSIELVAIASASFTGVENDNEQVQYVNNRPYNYWDSNLPTHYHPGLRSHENFSYGNSRNVLQPALDFDNKVAEKKPSLENILSIFIAKT